MRKWLSNLLRVLVAVGAFYYLFRHKVDVRGLWSTVKDVHLGWLMLSIVLFGSPFLCGVLRWRLLLGCQGVHLPLRRVTAICFVGQFFNAFLLGGTGGDVVKAYYVAKQTRTHKTEAAMTVVVDRMIGLVALFALLLVMIAWQYPLLQQYPALRWPVGTALTMVMAVFVVVPLTLWPGIRRGFGWAERFLHRLPGIDQLKRAAQSYQGYLQHRAVLFQAWLLSLVVHVSNFIACVCIGRALGIELGWEKYFLCVPVINTIASLPITVSGFGVREELYRRMFGEFGVTAEAAVAVGLLNYGKELVWSLAGGVVYMFWRHEPHLARRAREELVDDSGVQTDVITKRG